MKLDRELMVAALEGLQAQRVRLDSQIDDLQTQLGNTPDKTRTKKQAVSPPQSKPVSGTGRNVSAAGREAIAAAQRKRWAKIRKEKKAAEKAKTAAKSGETKPKHKKVKSVMVESTQGE